MKKKMSKEEKKIHEKLVEALKDVPTDQLLLLQKMVEDTLRAEGVEPETALGNVTPKKIKGRKIRG